MQNQENIVINVIFITFIIFLLTRQHSAGYHRQDENGNYVMAKESLLTKISRDLGIE